jgi:hypothetical protein
MMFWDCLLGETTINWSVEWTLYEQNAPVPAMPVVFYVPKGR